MHRKKRVRAALGLVALLAATLVPLEFDAPPGMKVHVSEAHGDFVCGRALQTIFVDASGRLVTSSLRRGFPHSKYALVLTHAEARERGLSVHPECERLRCFRQVGPSLLGTLLLRTLGLDPRCRWGSSQPGGGWWLAAWTHPLTSAVDLEVVERPEPVPDPWLGRRIWYRDPYRGE